MSAAHASLQAEHRAETGKNAARRLRRAGRLPAVLYGKGMDPVSLSLDTQEAVHLFQSVSVENTILHLRIGEEKAMRALVREIQTHPYKPDILHVDLMRLQRAVAVEVNVPLVLSGTPVGARQGGRLNVVVHEVSVRCTPSRIPKGITVDVSELDVGDSLRFSDVPLNQGIALLSNPGTMVCHVARTRASHTEEQEEGFDEI